MARVVELKNGETISIIDDDKFSVLSDLIYEYLGSDCYRLFVEYDDLWRGEKNDR